MAEENNLTNSRDHFDQRPFESAPDDTLVGTEYADTISGDPKTVENSSLPAAVAFWSFEGGIDGVFSNDQTGPSVTAYRAEDGVAVVAAETPTRPGPGEPASSRALEFNGDSAFAFIEHDAAMEISQGTIALWVQPDDLSDDAIILSKDQSGAGDGGHFRFGHEKDGRLFIRFANGDGGSNKSWETSASYLNEGEWCHVAINFSAEGGVQVFVDGKAVPDYAWIRQEGNEDLPSLQSEAYLLQNEEPWILGADTSGTKNNDTPQAFVTDDPSLDDPFDGAIADFGIWGGSTADDVLTEAQINHLIEQGPDTALTEDAAATILAGADTINGDGGDDQINGGSGADFIEGGYGDDKLEGGGGDDVLEGGRGSDYLLGGDGDDVLVSRSDAGEQRIGQRVVGRETRGDANNEVNPAYDKLYGWEDQPLASDDIMFGGNGADTFLFNPQINGKRDIIMEHVNDDRTIDWAGVAGENDNQHDHWVDSFGIDTIGDYNADEDTIAIVGHTAAPEVRYKLIDSDGDGVDDELVSIIDVYSNQHGGGGAHNEDLIGQIVVHGDLVDEDDLVVEANVTHGIVETVDELNEALAPTGDEKVSTLSDGSTFKGYDSRDDQGNLGEVVENPDQFITNDWLEEASANFASNVPEGTPPPVAVIDDASHPVLAAVSLSGEPADGETDGSSPGAYVNVPHTSGLAQTAGTIAFNFTAESVDGFQTLASKDHSGYGDGGHFMAWLYSGGVKVRYQSESESVYLYARDTDIEPGEQYSLAFTFDAGEAALYIDGRQTDVEDLTDNAGFEDGMSGNTQSFVLGASTTSRTEDQLNKLKDFFQGTIEDFVVFDRALYPVEVAKYEAGALPTVGSDEPAPDASEPAAPEVSVELAVAEIPVAPGVDVPTATSFWTFDDGIDGVFGDAMGGPDLTAYRNEDGVAVPADETPTRPGPRGAGDQALEFNGDTSFAFIEHDQSYEMTQGTIALWVQPDDVSDDGMFLSKDQSGSGDGGHIRFGYEDGGHLFIRFANGDGSGNRSWESSAPYLSDGEWTHLAMSFSADGGVTVYVNGAAVPDYGWIRREGNEDLPSLQSEAYLFQNSEPWVVGADTYKTGNNDTAADFAADDANLRNAFDGAIGEIGIWGGFDADDVLSADEIMQLYVDGPGTALSPAEPTVVETVAEMTGTDGHDTLEGDHGDNRIDGGAGDDVLHGGFGADLLRGGEGDDLLVSRSDAGEQRIGQLVTGEPTRPNEPGTVDLSRYKLVGYEDQPFVADDIMFGGAGADTFLFNPQINAKRDIIFEHVNDDRTINWAGVAGENTYTHDHWVDSFGIDIIGDYDSSEDSIAIVGHTVAPEVDYRLVDTDGDGNGDELVSVITVYSNQHGGGGAHDGDLIGQIVVHGDLVDPDDLLIDAGVTHGIVETIDEIDDALFMDPIYETLDLKASTLEDDSVFVGYDSRDNAGNTGDVIDNPEKFVTNSFYDDVKGDFRGNVPDGVETPNAILDGVSHPDLGSVTFTGNPADGKSDGSTPGAYVDVAHFDALARDAGTYAFSFTADSVGCNNRTLMSKDARTYEDGGHLTGYIDGGKELVFRFQSTNESVYLKTRNTDLEAGHKYHVAFTFTAAQAALYLDGRLVDTEDLSDKPEFAAGMTQNLESLVLGASTQTRSSGELNNLKDFFDGTIDDFLVLDRALYPAEVLKLTAGALSVNPAEAAPDDPEPEPEPEPVPEDQELIGTSDADELVGGAGNDTLDGRRGDDMLDGGAGNDTLLGRRGADKLYGGRGDDALSGDGGDDRLFGGRGNDLLEGGAGNDVLRGGRDDDVLIGGAGDDVMRGDAGADTFRFLVPDGGGTLGADRIRKFDADDRIEVSADLSVSRQEFRNRTELTLTKADGETVGTVKVFGHRVEDDDIFVYTPDLGGDTVI